MRIIEERFRGEKGEIKLVPESLDDLWHLKYIIEPGDIVFSLTKRVRESDDKIRSDKERITVRLGVEVERVEFHRFSNRLRITGRIVAGIEDSGYHTINITVGKELSIMKKWKDEQLKRIRMATERRPEILIVTIEEGEAIAGFVREWGIEEVFDVKRTYSKDSSLRTEFFHDVLKKIDELEFKYLVVAGPGFTKDDFIKFIREKRGINAIKCDTSSIGTRGFVEVLKRGVLERIAGEVRLCEEARYIEELLKRISKNEKVAYGLDEVKKAYEFGAIETLMIVDEFLIKQREKWDIDRFLREIEDMNAKIIIMSSDFEPGRILMSLGGIAALLRFSIDF